MDTKYLNDILNYVLPSERKGRFQHTIRDEATGTLYLHYSSELSKTDTTMAIERVLTHLKTHGIDAAQIVAPPE
jgi:hypothetical protein